MAASLLLLLEEEDAFWMMATIVEDLLPASYYSSTLLGNIFCQSYKIFKINANLVPMIYINYHFHRYSS